jgi:GNAT superfamily N-acetyltransferase
MSTLRIVVDPHAPDSSKHFVQTALDMYSVAVTGLDEYYPVAIFLKQETEEIAGGLLGDIWGAWFHVTSLWVAASLRRHGYGSQLLRAAEQYAIERGCQQVHLETFSFQARPLYEKHGYEVFGQLEECPPGHTKYFLRKRLAVRAATSPEKPA